MNQRSLHRPGILFGIFLLLVGGLTAQPELYIIRTVDHPSSFITNGIEPDKITEDNDGSLIYLDSESGQIARFQNSKIILGGGTGTEEGALLDAIDVNAFYPDVWVTDRALQKVVQYDSRLAKLNEISLGDVYPESSVMDPWGNLYFYSDRTEKVYVLSRSGIENSPFIDLTGISEGSSGSRMMHFSQDGELGILNGKNNLITIFNRIGRPVALKRVELKNPKYIFKYNNQWMACDGFELELIETGKNIKLPFNKEPIDIKPFNDGIAFLTNNSTVICGLRDQ